METGDHGRLHSRRTPWSGRHRLMLLAGVMLVASLSLALLYWPTSPFRERYVSYDYSITIDSSDVFTVICPLPADYSGLACPDVVSSVLVQGDASVSMITTPYGEGLEIEGAGSAVVTWTYSYIYRSSTESFADHYSNLSMLSSGYYNLGGSEAFVFAQGPDVNLSLVYCYDHVYGSLGADYLRYEASSTLIAGWSSTHVDFDWMVS